MPAKKQVKNPACRLRKQVRSSGLKMSWKIDGKPGEKAFSQKCSKVGEMPKNSVVCNGGNLEKLTALK